MGMAGMSTKNIGWMVVAVLLLVAGIFLAGKLGSFSTVESQKEIVQVQGNNEFQSTNPSVDLNVRIQDTLATTVAYINGTIYVKNLDTGSITSYSITAANANGAFDNEANIMKSTSKNGYEIWVQSDADDYNSDSKTVITAEMLKQDPVEVTIKGTKHTLTKFKAYDSDAKASLYGDLSDSDNSTDYITHNGTTITITTTATLTGKTVGADGFIDYEFTIAPVTANEQNGNGGVICVNYADDTDVNDWDGDTLELTFDGTVLSETSLSDNDKIALNSYEKCFGLPYSVGTNSNGGVKSQHKLKFYLQSASGVNPDFDPTLRLIGLGDYQSQKDASKMLEGVLFQDNTARTALDSASTQVVSLTIV